jgi:histidinol dehydrogenase
MLRILAAGSPATDKLLSRRVTRDPALVSRVQAIVDEVRHKGDRAVRKYARQFDGLEGNFEVGQNELAAAYRAVSPATRRALTTCARNIRRVALAQLPRTSRVTVAPGVVIEHRAIPLASVGCYVPAGRYPLPSSLLMSAIPARVAGVPEIVVACPRPDAVVLAAAVVAGATRVFRVGGAHGISALAYGTATFPAVDKIVGPGSRFVACAKSLVSQDCAIDFEAGPSELVWCSDGAPLAWVAADLIAQAEHDPDARALLITTSRAYAGQVQDAVQTLAPKTGPARAALRRNGAIVVAPSQEAAVALVNRCAPEHLATDNDFVVRSAPRAGTVFVGAYAPPAAGDYATGSNHVLPTAGAARFRGGLCAADFVRMVTVQRVTRLGLMGIAGAAVAMARLEGLSGHALSIEARLK